MYYIRNEGKPVHDPDEFKEMLEGEEPKLQGFFDDLIARTNPQKKVLRLISRIKNNLLQ
jgi:hypothetical protein